MAPKQRRVNYAQLFAFSMMLKENPGEWHPIPTHSTNPDQIIVRQRKGLIPSLLPEEGYVSKQQDFIAYAMYEGK